MSGVARAVVKRALERVRAQAHTEAGANAQEAIFVGGGAFTLTQYGRCIRNRAEMFTHRPAQKGPRA